MTHTLTTETMKTTMEKLTQELEMAKLNIKIANACIIIVDSFINRDIFKFNCYTGDKELFRNGNFWDCRSLNITSTDVKNHEETYKIVFDRNLTTTKKLKTALKFVEKELTKENGEAWTILHNVANEKLTL